MPRKLLFLIADGMGDYPVAELGERTPLEAAQTPNMDSLAKMGVVGKCQTVPPGLPPGSDIANMSLLGYDPKKYHTGRGPIEAAAQGLELSSRDLVYRLNLCKVSEFSENGIMLDYCAGHIDTESAQDIISGLKSSLENETFHFVAGMQYRHLLVQKNGALDVEMGLSINPPHDISNQSLKLDINEFSRSEKLYNLVSKAAELLSFESSKAREAGIQDKDGRANSIWPWGQGPPLSLPEFSSIYQYSGGVISAVDLIKGLGRATGLKVHKVPGATGLLDTNYAGKVQKAREILNKEDFVFLHVEAPDECGHSGSAEDKIRAIQDFDEKIVGPLMQEINSYNASCLVACDHLTPLCELTHTRDPVPFLFFDPLDKENSGVKDFSEKSASTSGIFVNKGHSLLSRVLERMFAFDSS